jgi:YVTN family beta-propeller protein
MSPVFSITGSPRARVEVVTAFDAGCGVVRRTLIACLAFGLGAEAVAADVAYVANQGAGTVSIIDTTEDTVTRSLPDQGSIGAKVQAVVANRAGTRAFVVDADDGALMVVDIATGRIEKRLAVGKAPEGGSLAPSGKLIAVTVEDDDEVAIVDVASAKLVRKIHVQGSNPEHAAWSSDDRWLLVSNENSSNLDLLDVKAGRSIAVIADPGHPRGLAWLPGRRIAYVANEHTGSVDVVDVDARAILQSIKTGVRPAGALAAADGKRVFVSNGGDGTVSVVDTGTRAVVATIPVGKRPWGMALTHDGRKLYVANGRSNSVSVIDTATLAVIKEIPVGVLPWGVSIP